MDEAGGPLKNAAALHGGAVEGQSAANAVLPGQLGRSKPTALAKTQRERDYALNTSARGSPYTPSEHNPSFQPSFAIKASP